MSNETAAAHLARLKLAYPTWKLWHGQATGEYWAQPPVGHPQQALISAPTLAGLEAKLVQSEARREP